MVAMPPEPCAAHPEEECPAGDFDIPGDPELLAQGWVRRNLADPSRATEVTRLYTELGFEVRAEPLLPTAFGPECGGCALDACRSYVMIYTRKAPPGSA